MVARGGEGTGECVENVRRGGSKHTWRLGPKNRLKGRVGCGGRGPENSSQSSPFLPPFHLRAHPDSGARRALRAASPLGLEGVSSPQISVNLAFGAHRVVFLYTVQHVRLQACVS